MNDSASRPNLEAPDGAAAPDARRAGRPTAEDSRALNARIIEAAFQAFVREGYAGATIEQIALIAGTTRRSVGHRFIDKEALLLAVVEVKMREHVAEVVTTDALSSPRPLEALRQTCAVILDSADNDMLIAFFRLCVSEAAKLPAASATFLRVNDRLEEDLQALVRRAQHAGALGDHDPRVLASVLVGAYVSNPINRITMGDQRFRDPAFRKRYFDDTWRFVTSVGQ